MRRSRWTGTLLFLLVPAALLAADALHLVVTLKHRDARSVLARVSQELGPTGRISLDGQRNRIVVDDEAPYVQNVARLIAQLDQPARRFAIAARLDIYPAPPGRGLFSGGGTITDMTHWMEGARPARSHDAVLNLDEGGAASAALGTEYSLGTVAGGYDPSRRRLNLRSLQLWKAQGNSRKALLSGGAVLPEGRETALVVGAEEDHPPLKLHLTPNLMLRAEGGAEVPRR
jgi:hypothetical protein